MVRDIGVKICIAFCVSPQQLPARWGLPSQSTFDMNELPRTWKILTVWLLLGTLVFLGVQALLRSRNQVQISLGDGAVTLRRAADGHYHWPGSVNGRRVDFLVDTGATVTTLPGPLARALDLPPGRTVNTQTAAGAATAYLSQVDLELDGGPRVGRMPITVMDGLEAPLLGMDLMGRLHIEQSQGQMRLRAP
jgi:aspartyl protease family protein